MDAAGQYLVCHQPVSLYGRCTLGLYCYQLTEGEKVTMMQQIARMATERFQVDLEPYLALVRTYRVIIKSQHTVYRTLLKISKFLYSINAL